MARITWAAIFFVFLSITVVFASTTGSSPFRVVVSNGAVYVFNQQRGFVRNIPLGFRPSAFDVDQNRLYYSNALGRTLIVYDLASGTVVHSSTFSGRIAGIAHDSVRNQIYVLDQSGAQIRILDDISLALKAVVDVPRTPVHMSFIPQGNSLYVASTNKTITIYSVDSLRETGRIENLDADPVAVYASPAADKLLVQHAEFVSVYRLSTLEFYDAITEIGWPQRIQLDSTGTKAFILLTDRKNIAVYDLASLSLDDWIYTGYRTYRGKSINASSYLVDQTNGQVYFLDSATQALITEEATIFTGPTPSQVLPMGATGSSDLLINTSDDGPQSVPDADFDAAGDFVIAWKNNNDGVFAREFNATLPDPTAPLPDFKAKGGDARTPTVGVDSSGNFTVGWTDGSGADGSSLGIFANRYLHGGTAQPPTIGVNKGKSGAQRFGTTSGIRSGGFVSAWSSGDPGDGSGRATYFRRFDASGNAIDGSDVQVNTFKTGDTFAVGIDTNSNGDFVVVWRDGASPSRIRARFVNANGSFSQSSDVMVDPHSSGASVFNPTVGVADNGDFVIAWHEKSGGTHVWAERFNKNQVKQGGVFQVSSKFSGGENAPSIGMATDGSFVISWRDTGYGNNQVAARAFDSSGNPIANDFVVPNLLSGNRFEANTAIDDVGNYLISWHDKNPAAGMPTIQARYFSVTPPPPTLTVTNANPQHLDRGATNQNVVITGTGFTSNATVNFNDVGITVNNNPITPTDDTHLTANITVTAAAFYGFHDITVTVGGNNATGTGLFEVKPNGGYPAPTVSGTVPAAGNTGQTLDVNINGSSFANHPNLSASFGSGITVNTLTWVSDILVTANITIAGNATPGFNDVKVTNPGGATGTCTGCFQIIFSPFLFSDDFTDGSASDWTFTGGTWSAATNQLAGNDGGTQTALAPFGGCVVCTLDIDVNIVTVKGYILGWYQNDANHVELLIEPGKNNVKLTQFVAGNDAAKLSVTQATGFNTFHHFKIVYAAGIFTVFIDGGVTPIITLPQAVAPFSGTIGAQIKGSSILLDNVVVSP